MSGNTNRKRVYAHIKQDRFIVDNMEDATVWDASADVTALTTAVNHKEGTSSISFAKSATATTTGSISKTLDNPINLVEFLRGKLRYWINLSDLTNVASVSLTIGESASHNYIYTTVDTDLSTGWNEVSVDVDSPTATTGNGGAWSSIDYIAITVTFDASANTLTDILVDSISAYYELNVNVETLNLSGTGLATAANQATAITSLQLIDNLVLAEDAVHGSGDPGLMPLAVRNDTLAALAGTDGDYAPFQVDASGALYVNISGEGIDMDIEGATAKDAAATENPLLAGMEFEALGAIATDGGTAGDKVPWKAAATGIPYVGLTDIAGTKEAILLEDTAHASGDAGVMSLAVRNDTLAALAGTDGDYSPLQVDPVGALYVRDSNPSAIEDGRKTVGTAGSAEALAGSTTAKEITITAETDNTGVIVVGGSSVVAAVGTRRGVPLTSGDSFTMTVPGEDLANIYLDTTVNGDGVTYLYTT